MKPISSLINFVKCSCVILLALHIQFLAFGQKLIFEHIDSLDGLSNNWIRCFHQDQTGFLWIGTVDGLNRYDGNDIKVSRVLVPGSDREVGTTINAIASKASGELWVSTDIGLYVYRCSDDSFSFFDELGSIPVFHVLEDSKGRLWFSTRRGLYRQDSEKAAIVKLDLGAVFVGPALADYVNLTFEDSMGRIWVCSKDVIRMYEEDTNDFAAYARKDESGKKLESDILSIGEDGQGRLWLGLASGGGLNLLVDEGDAIRFEKVLDGDVIDLLVDRDNVLWVARGGGGGLSFFDLDSYEVGKTPTIVTEFHDRSESTSIGDSSLTSIFEDREGDFWIGSFGKGVSFTSKRFKPITLVEDGPDTIPNSLVNTFLDEEDALWIGTEGGLSRYNKNTGDYSVFVDLDSGENQGLGTDPVFDIERDSRGNLWVGGWRSGLSRFDEVGNGFTRFLPSEDEGTIISPFVFSILEDRNGKLWIGTIDGGLSRFDYESETFKTYPDIFRDKDTNYNWLSTNDILETSDGRLFVSCYDRLVDFDPVNETGTVYLHSAGVDNGNNGSYIDAVFEDSFGVLWLATGAGLEYFDREKKQFFNYTKADGLAGDGVRGILEAEDGSLWVSCGRGLSKFVRSSEDPRKGVFRSIDYGYGIAGSEFKKRSAYHGVDGRMYFGTSKGYISFDPKEFFFNETIPTIIISEASQLVARPNSPNVYSPINSKLLNSERLSFPYDHPDVRITFSALNFLSPEANRYRYRLTGYDSDWVDAGTSNVATYTNIDPGSYTFEVMGSNNDNIWNPTSLKLAFVVESPWWATSWFRALAVLFVAVLFAAGYRIRTDAVRRRELVLTKLVEARTSELAKANEQLAFKQSLIEARNEELAQQQEGLERMVEARTRELEIALQGAKRSDQLKSAFLANLSHEIRTPMNAIIGFSTLLKDEQLGAKSRNSYIEIIGDSCQSLLVLIDDILDLSMIESGQLEFRYNTVDIDSILEGLHSYYELKNDKKLELNLEMQGGIGRLWMETDATRFKQVFVNLLSNAYKFTERGGIDFGYEIKRECIRFYVKDTGIGIMEKDQSKVFDRFYKIEDDMRQLYRGTGLGLAISSEIVRMLGGEIQLKSRYGSGTEFWFEVPVKQCEGEVLEAAPEQALVDLEGLEVLVAEDEDINFELVRILLEKAGAKVVRARNGLEAVDCVKNKTRAEMLLVLMDLKMPIMDGYECFTEIRKINPNVPIVAQTAFAQRVDRERVLEIGFDGYIAKPIDEQLFFEAISKVVSR